MTPAPEEGLVARALERSAWEYGKIGLLIDDSPECSIRVARALYGCDALPPWWNLVRSIGCACSALEKVSELLSDPSFRPLRVFIMMDRYLPPGCRGGGAIAWYEGDDIKGQAELVAAMNGRVARILDLDQTEREIRSGWTEETACLIQFVTSFPVISTTGMGGGATLGKGAPDLFWQMRSVELLQKERRELRRSEQWSCLLRFGPEGWARIAREEPPPAWMEAEAEPARWRARTWRETLQRLVRMFEKERVILITGAGASLSASPMGPGILPTHEIVRTVCREILSGRPEPRPRPVPPDCVCRSLPPTVDAPETTGELVPVNTPIGRLIQQVDSKKPLEFKLEEVCSPELHQGSDVFLKFHRLFRRELYKRDYGFAYHHWLLARLPWTAVITTNFDGFHERASAAVARMLSADEEERLRVLSLGSVASSEPITGQGRGGKPKSSAERMGESRLFKPYGSLYSPTGELALGSREVFDFQGHFEAALGKALTAVSGPAHAGAIVVIGQSMRDELVRTVLERLQGRLARYQLLWVDPNAFTRCRLTPAAEQTLWETWVTKKMKGRGDGAPPAGPTGSSKQVNERACSGPVPATALEFVYDLWTVYRSKDEP